MHDYWIGDRVWIASLQHDGIFEGEQGDLAIVKVDNEKKLFPFSDLTLLPEEEVDVNLEEPGVQTKPSPKHAFAFPDSIDLHIDELNPKLVNAEPALILAHQRSRLIDFLTAAIFHHKSQVTIIHGIGEGVLRSEVLNVLSGFDEIRSIEHEPHGGAVLVKLK